MSPEFVSTTAHLVFRAAAFVGVDKRRCRPAVAFGNAAALPLPICIPPIPVCMPPVIISAPADAALLARRSCDADIGSIPALMLLMLLLPDEWVPPSECGREAADGSGAAAEEPAEDEPVAVAGLGRVANEVSGAAAVAPAGPSGGRAGEPVLLIMFQRAGSATQTVQKPNGRQTNAERKRGETVCARDCQRGEIQEGSPSIITGSCPLTPVWFLLC